MADFLDREAQAYDALQSRAELELGEEEQRKRQAQAELQQQENTTPKQESETGGFLGGAMDIARQGVDPEDPLKAVGGAKQSAAMGVVDTAMDAVGAVGQLVPWLSPLNDLDEAYDANFGRDTEQDPAKKIVRDISATVIPTLTIGGAVAGGLKAATASKVMLSSRTHLLGRIAAEAGVGTAVTAVSDQTEEQENLATLMYELTGIDVPWRHVDGDSPYWAFAKIMV